MSKEAMIEHVPKAKKIAEEWYSLCKDFEISPQVLAIR